MNAHPVFIPCPYLDRLGHDLIQAYRSMEDRDVFEMAYGAETRGNNDVSSIHAAIAQHRRNCPICRAEVAMAMRVERTMHTDR